MCVYIYIYIYIESPGRDSSRRGPPRGSRFPIAPTVLAILAYFSGAPKPFRLKWEDLNQIRNLFGVRVLLVLLITITIIITVSFHNFKSQNFKLSVSNPKNKCVAYLSVLSQISNCQGLGRKNKHDILKTDRIFQGLPPHLGLLPQHPALWPWGQARWICARWAKETFG